MHAYCVSLSLKGVLQLQNPFQPFLKLSEEKQDALYRILQELLLCEETVTQLEDVVILFH